MFIRCIVVDVSFNVDTDRLFPPTQMINNATPTHRHSKLSHVQLTYDSNLHVLLRRGSCISVHRITSASNQNSSVADAANSNPDPIDLASFSKTVNSRRNFRELDERSRERIPLWKALSTGTSRLFACEIISRITTELCHDDTHDVKCR